MNSELRVERRRALEALRAGVPNRDAVMVLGSLQQGVEDRFSLLMGAVRALPGGPRAGRDADRRRLRVGQEPRPRAPGARRSVRGLRRLQGRDLQGDTPATTRPRCIGPPSTTPRCPGARVRRSTKSPRACSSTPPATPTSTTGPIRKTSPVDSRFAATLFLYEHVRGDEEFADRIVRFWAGDPLAGSRSAPAAQGGGCGGHLPAGDGSTSATWPGSGSGSCPA